MRLPLHVHLAYGLLLTSLAHSKDPYEVLGVDRNAPIDHIRKEYRRLVKEW